VDDTFTGTCAHPKYRKHVAINLEDHSALSCYFMYALLVLFPIMPTFSGHYPSFVIANGARESFLDPGHTI
jgi:hypothetical protein